MPAVGNSSNFRSLPAKAPPPRPVANLHTGNNPRGAAILPPRPVAPARSFAARVGSAITRTAPAATSAARHVSSPVAHPLVQAASPATRRLAVSLAGRANGNRSGLFSHDRVVAAMSRYATQNPFEPIATNAPIETAPLQHMRFQALFNQEFSNLQKQGLLPPGTKAPPLKFPSHGHGRGGGLSFETGRGRNAVIHISEPTVEAALNPSLGAQAWGRQTPIHELAHAMQNTRAFSTKPEREGGAQAFADAAAVQAVGPISQNDTNYSGYTQAVRGMGPQWYMQGQFAPDAATASPALGATGTFRVRPQRRPKLGR